MVAKRVVLAQRKCRKDWDDGGTSEEFNQIKVQAFDIHIYDWRGQIERTSLYASHHRRIVTPGWESLHVASARRWTGLNAKNLRYEVAGEFFGRRFSTMNEHQPSLMSMQTIDQSQFSS
jgi:hypothetical protein